MVRSLTTARTELYNSASELLSIVDVWNLDASLNSRTLKDIHHASTYQKLASTIQGLLAIQALIRSTLPATVEVCRIMQKMNHLIEDVMEVTNMARIRLFAVNDDEEIVIQTTTRDKREGTAPDGLRFFRRDHKRALQIEGVNSLDDMPTCPWIDDDGGHWVE